MTAKDVAHIFEGIAPLDSGIAGDQLGFVYGDPDVPVTGLGCTWCIQADSLRYCAERSLNMVICHEDIWLPKQTSPWYQGPAENGIFANRLRREMLDQNKMVVYRSHSNWDALPVYGVTDSAFPALGLKGVKEIGRQKFFSVQELPEDRSIKELRDVVEQGLSYPGCRIFGDAEKRVRRIAFLIGGFGENQYHIPQVAMEMGAEALIIGEMSEFIVIACLEMGLPVIESLHSVSEIPGIRNQASILARRLYPLCVEYVPSGALIYLGGREANRDQGLGIRNRIWRSSIGKC